MDFTRLRHIALPLLFVLGCGHAADRALEHDHTAEPSDSAHTAEDIGPADPDDTSPPPTDASPPAEADVGVLALPSAELADEGRFATAVVCARCHANEPSASAMRDQAGQPIGPYDLWRSTMMANAARDPLWRAVVSVEVAAHPTRAAAIEDKCAGCHAPMLARTLDDQDEPTALARLALDDAHAALGRDGVSCALCHQIEASGLGAEASFTAGFALADRLAYGPHAAPFANPMVNNAGFTPLHGDHVMQSALCGSCHTLATDALDARGEPTGDVLLEQGPYLEWRASAYSTEGTPGPAARSCQDCHVPPRDDAGDPITTRIARRPAGGDFPPVAPRAPYGRHVFVGGNSWVLALLDRERALLSTPAPSDAFAATIAATRAQLAGTAARLTITRIAAATGLSFAVTVDNLTGHKLPTGHPTRRMWLHVRVRDAEGRVLFESGAFDGAGRLVDHAGQPLSSELVGAPIAPHVDRVTDPRQVASWEAVMADAEGAPTFILLSGARWLRDDRILPAGFAPSGDSASRIAPRGVDGDQDFVPGADTVRFDLDVTGAATIDAELLYTPLSARWQAELFAWQTPEMQAFASLFRAAALRPERLAHTGLAL